MRTDRRTRRCRWSSIAVGRCGGCCGRRTSCGFARAYVSGDVDLEGDVFTGLAEMDRLADPETGPGIVVDRRTRRRCWPRCCGSASSARRRDRRRRRPGSAGGGTPGAVTRGAIEPPLRRRQRLLRAGPRPVADLLLRLLRRRPDGTTLDGRPAGQVRPRLPQARAGGGMRVLDVGCGWGTLGDPRRPHVRRPRGGRHDQPAAGRLARARVAGGRAGRPGRDPGAGLPRRPGRPVRRHRQHRHVRARRRTPTWRSTSPPCARCSRRGGRLLNHAISRRPGPPDAAARRRSSTATSSPTAS